MADFYRGADALFLDIWHGRLFVRCIQWDSALVDHQKAEFEFSAE